MQYLEFSNVLSGQNQKKNLLEVPIKEEPLRPKLILY